jgi:xyloglucan fucosyltransferase
MLFHYPCRLDELTDSISLNIGPQSGLRNSSILLASLNAEVKAGLNLTYGAFSSKTVDFHVFASNNEVSHHAERLDHNEAALLDMWLLSYAQTLIVTPSSTFGNIPRALGGSDDTYILDKVDGCTKSRALDPCYQVPPDNIRCAPIDGARGQVGSVESLFGVLSNCDENFEAGGLQVSSIIFMRSRHQ